MGVKGGKITGGRCLEVFKVVALGKALSLEIDSQSNRS